MSIKEPVYIVAGDAMKELMEKVFPERKTIPFREDLSKGTYEGFVIDRDFIRNRASFWNVSEDEYSDKIAPIIDLDLSQNFILCFGEDDCCRANLEFLIGYLKGRGYSRTIQIKIVNEYDLNEIREYTV